MLIIMIIYILLINFYYFILSNRKLYNLCMIIDVVDINIDIKGCENCKKIL